MTVAASLDAFEVYLAEMIGRMRDGAPLAAMMRDHFGFDDPAAMRGKRLRPRILLAVVQTEGAKAEEAFGVAGALELLHNFSLIHDDIEDGDEMRRGRPTLWSRYGVASAIEAGNALCTLTYLTLIEGAKGRPPADVLAMETRLLRAHHAMCVGQSRDIAFETAASVSFDEYVAMIDGKTAALFSAACELGALAAGTTHERALAYGRVGRAYGLAFQIRDDILGTWGSSKETGKPSGADIRRRKWSFPITWALDRPPGADRDVVARVYAANTALDDPCVGEVIAALDRLGARRAADEACARYVDEADAVIRAYDLDREGDLATIFRATMSRTA